MQNADQTEDVTFKIVTHEPIGAVSNRLAGLGSEGRGR